MNMKENQETAFYDPKSFGKKADALAFESKEACQVNGSKRTNDPIAFEIKVGGKHWNINNVDAFLNNRGSGRLESPRKSSAAKGEEKLHCSPAVESSIVDMKSESSDLGSPQMTTSGLFEKDPDFFTDKNVLECESPELTVRDKEINLHDVKDICIDEGMPTKGKILVESCKDDQPGAGGGINNVYVISNGVEAESLGNNRSIGETECGKTGVSYDELLAQCRLKLPSGNFSADDSCKNCEMEDPVQIGETNCVGTENPEEESYVESKLPIQEFETRSFLCSFFKSLDDEGNKAVEQHDKIFLGEEGSKIPEAAADAESEAGKKEDIEPNTVLYDSKIEGGSITFNFNSSEHEVSNVTNEQTVNSKEELTESANVHAHRDGNADNISDSSITQCATTKENATVEAGEQVGDAKNEDSDRSTEGIPVQHVSSEDVKNEKAHDDQEPHPIKHGRRNSDEASVISQLRHDDGESSFTAAGLITYSGPIAYSGSLSLRSDGSAASGRSFAFPILQSEWNSSPVRMAKADRRHFRKHKGWRSGLLCCRF
ncbi:dentin sialophosphoprotein-like [Dorcoceras hygrometricum]|uniref:Dentin sialophosphoprotein-like n=1 Tax=Dorcoceras hygrometricum TaxID=472368 RepID=A0A2Z7CT90_9LAMI|nr:dentin sialophosphoprotein-like [Dorcoceras hygrometricum]